MLNKINYNHELQQQLSRTLQELGRSLEYKEYDFIVTHCEINTQHGVGVLLQRIFPDSSNFFAIRSKNLYDAQQSFGDQDIC
ncbi:MAG: hypothetical protein ACRC6M_09565, partial [Microcystaceae cyanobacterium]